MKQALIILAFGFILIACEQNDCSHSLYLEPMKSKKETKIKKTDKAHHSFIEKDCDIINEWLNRKSISNFIKNYISL